MNAHDVAGDRASFGPCSANSRRSDGPVFNRKHVMRVITGILPLRDLPLRSGPSALEFLGEDLGVEHSKVLSGH